MPFAPVKNPKTDRLYVRFRPEEKQRVEAEARKAGMTVSEYVRRRALGIPVKSRVSEQAINELRRLGGLQKHLVLQDATHTSEYAAVLRAILAAIRQLEASGK